MCGQWRVEASAHMRPSAAVEQVVRRTPIDRAHLSAAIDKVLHAAHVASAVRPKVAHTLLVILVLKVR